MDPIDRQNNSKDRSAIFEEVSVPAGLLDAVMVRIAKARQGQARNRSILCGVISLASLFAFIPALISLKTQWYHSGVYEIVSLAFSDMSMIAGASLKDFLLSIAESLPLISIMLSFGALLAFLWSLRAAVMNLQIFSRMELKA